jgi:hypothetical protein
MTSLTERSFRLYNRLNSSVFDLIAGDREVQQTKGLGLILSKSDVALRAFLAIPKIRKILDKIALKKVDRLVVNCELISVEGSRADIVLRFYCDDQPLFAIVVEAKSINKNTSANDAMSQLNRYLIVHDFKELKEFRGKCYGVSLTKFPSAKTLENIVSVGWEDLIEIFFRNMKADETGFLSDYFDFLTNIRGSMKFYEREVYSIPTVQWSFEAIERFNVYECPNEGMYVIKYKPLFLAFRRSNGGVMEKLHPVESIIILNFKESYETFLHDEESYPADIRERVKNYVDFMIDQRRWTELPSDTKQVFLLASHKIDLPKQPRPRVNNSFRTYYTLADLLENEICGAPERE